MNISGIRPISGFSSYNEISSIGAAKESTKPQELEKAQESVDSSAKIKEQESARKQQTFGAYDYANQYNPGVTYSMKGAESDIKTLDVEKAVDDMRRDEVLHQYQYFVGNQRTMETQATTVRGAENFTL